MNKLAIFVEGYTEVVFVDRLVREVAGEHNVRIETRRITGGSTVARRMHTLQAASADTGQRFFVLIVDCGGDHQVKSRIREEHENLDRAGYSRIIGLHDVRPRFTHADIPRLQASLPRYIKTSLIPVEFVLAVMEIEAWFLAEVTHFEKIDPAITVGRIVTALGFNPETDNLELRPAPADDLKACYALGGKTYQKGNAPATIQAMDFAVVYAVLNGRVQQLGRLVQSLDAFLMQ